jgi:hypothetical protein
MEQTARGFRGSGGSPPLNVGRVKKLAIGDFEIRDANIYFVD